MGNNIEEFKEVVQEQNNNQISVVETNYQQPVVNDPITNIRNDYKAVSLKREYTHFLRGKTVQQNSRKANCTTQQLDFGQLFVSVNNPGENNVKQGSYSVENRGVYSCGVGKPYVHKEILTCGLHQAENQRICTKLFGKPDFFAKEKVGDKN